MLIALVNVLAEIPCIDTRQQQLIDMTNDLVS